MFPARCAALVAGLLLPVACAPRSTAPPPAIQPSADSAGAREQSAPSLPPVPEVRGPLAVRVVYPPPNAVVRARDSSFLFGAVGTGDARLAINGQPVRVWPNGAWLAWVPLPLDSLMRFEIVARTPTESVSVNHWVRRGEWRPPSPPGLWIDSTSFFPTGPVWWPREEYLTLRARASPGAEVRLRLPDGTLVPFQPVGEAVGRDGPMRGVGWDSAGQGAAARERYAAVIRGRAIGRDPGPILPASPLPPALPLATARHPGGAASPGCGDGGPPEAATPHWAVLEAIRGPDTVRSLWYLDLAMLDTLPLLAELDDDTARVGLTDSLTAGRALPGGTYHWFFPTGTLAPVSGRMGTDLRLRLAPGTEAWIAQPEARPVPASLAGPAVVGSVTLTPREDRVAVRVPLGRRVPLQVVEDERSLVLRLFGSVGDVNWIRHGVADTLVRQVRWRQEPGEVVSLTVDLALPVWGYRARWEGNDLLFEIRRPPRLDQGHPLRGRLIAVDPGHPPAGATGPTGLREAEANLAVALELRHLLEDEGARVLMTRTADVPLDLWPRVRMAESAGAEILVSVHNNALPDGVNPFTNSGSSVYYNQPRSVPLARAIQEELVHYLGVRDLGIGRGDLALVRATWMPSVLTEGLFMMLPDQEAALRTVDGRRRYAQGVFQGLRRFLRERGREK